MKWRNWLKYFVSFLYLQVQLIFQKYFKLNLGNLAYLNDLKWELDWRVPASEWCLHLHGRHPDFLLPSAAFVIDIIFGHTSAKWSHVANFTTAFNPPYSLINNLPPFGQHISWNTSGNIIRRHNILWYCLAYTGLCFRLLTISFCLLVVYMFS